MSEQPKHFALLIGIDAYPGTRLRGCVNDVEALQEVLRQWSSVKIRTLTATKSSEGGLVEDEEDWPTEGNVSSALESLRNEAREGDRIYIHYSGLGTMVRVWNPELGDSAQDMALVLLNVHAPKTREFPIIGILRGLTASTRATVTVVFDCRFYTPQHDDVRGIDYPRGLAILYTPWRWGEGVTVGGRDRGRLSYLVERCSLESGMTVRLKDVQAYVNHHSRRATAAGIYGDGNQTIFDEEPAISNSKRANFLPIPVEWDFWDGHLILQAGEAHGFRDGDELILHLSDPSSSVSDSILSIVKPLKTRIQKVHATTSTLESQDVPRKVHWVAESRTRLSLRDFIVFLDLHAKSLASLRETIAQHGWNVHEDVTRPYDFRIVASDGENPYQLDVLDSSGQSFIYHLYLSLAQTDAAELTRVLDHLANYALVKNLSNPASLHEAGSHGERRHFRDSFRILIKTRDGEVHQPDQPVELDERQDNLWTLELCLDNYSTETLFFYIFSLDSSWEIVLIHKARLNKDGRPSLRKKLRTFIEDKRRDGASYRDDIIKVFVTTQSTDLMILEQPGLGWRSKPWRPGHRGVTNNLTTAPEQWDAFNFPVRTYLRNADMEASISQEQDDSHGLVEDPTKLEKDEALLDQMSTEASHITAWSQKDGSTKPSTLSDHKALEQGDASADDHSGMTFLNYGRGQQHEQKMRDEEMMDEDDDIQSLQSSKDDTDASTNSWTAQNLDDVIDFVVDRFTWDDDLMELYREASARLDSARFLRNHQRLLRIFWLDLRLRGANSPSQEAAIQLFRSPLRRRRISSAIYQFLTPSDPTMQEKVKLAVEANGHEGERVLDRYLSGLDSAEFFHHSESLPVLDFMQGSDAYGDSDWSSSDVESEEEAQEDSQISKLKATGDFLMDGRPFQLLKENLRSFLHPPELIEKQEISLDMPKRDVDDVPFQDLRYSVSHLGGFLSNYQDIPKRVTEFIAGRPLSWWPLSEIEGQPRTGYTRVYSMLSSTSHRQFFDDVPTPLAERIFPKLRINIPFSTSSASFLSSQSHRTISLHGATLMQVLHSSKSNSSGGESQKSKGLVQSQTRQDKHLRTSGQAEPNPQAQLDHNDQATHNSPDEDPAVEAQGQNQGSPRQDHAAETVVYLSADIKSNMSVACPVKLGSDDKTTFETLKATHQKLSSWKWKRATGIKFYRFQTFYYKASLERHHVALHADKERYPQKDELEYNNYRYKPTEWTDEKPLPCLPGEAWYFFQNPSDCGTSMILNDALPVRLSAISGTRTVAWGMYVEQRYSAWIIIGPALLLLLVTVAATLWFAGPWLAAHPGDLQNATVPVMLALGIVGILLQVLISSLVFRWTV